MAADEDYWAEIRNAFSIDRNIINLNNGYCSPSPQTVQDAMRRLLDYSDMGPYHTMVNVLERQVETVRRRIADAAGCDPEEIAITRNSSESLENAQYGIDLSAATKSSPPIRTIRACSRPSSSASGAKASCSRRFHSRAHRRAWTISTAASKRRSRRRTKLILVCHITNLTGQIFPVKRICEMARARDIPVIVDGAHAFSHFPFRSPTSSATTTA